MSMNASSRPAVTHSSTEQPATWKSAAQTVVRIARLSLLFGRVERLTLHEDGKRRESDAEHTVMLGLVATAFAVRHLPFLDRGKVLGYALVHDLVEAYAGDTNTLRQPTDAAKRDKRDREHRAFLLIEKQMEDEAAWITEAIRDYEGLVCDEARYVKAMDKLLPKATHILNYCQTVYNEDMTFEDLARRYDTQYGEIREYLDPDRFRPVYELRGELTKMVFERYWKGSK